MVLGLFRERTRLRVFGGVCHGLITEKGKNQHDGVSTEEV